MFLTTTKLVRWWWTKHTLVLKDSEYEKLTNTS